MKKPLLIPILVIVLLLIITVTLFITMRPVQITKENGPNNLQTATKSNKIKTGRGSIFDRNHDRLAGNYPSYAIYAKPQEITNPELIIVQLAKILHQNQQQLLASLKAVRGYLWLAKDADSQTVEQLQKINIKGLYFKKSMKRYYPHNTSAAHLIGFSKENHGLDGLESRFDSLLRGESQNVTTLPMIDFGVAEQLGSNGAHLISTIDLSVQKHIEQKLSQLIAITGSTSGSAVVINADNGAIIALANLPSYDPNTFWNFDQSSRRNRAVTDTILNGPLKPQLMETDQNIDNEIKTVRLPSGRELPIVSPVQTKKVVSFTKTKKGREKLTFFRDLIEMSNSSVRTFEELQGQQSIKAKSNASVDSSASTSVQLLVALASLLKNGEQITPHLLSSIRDRASHKSFSRIRHNEPRFILNQQDAAYLLGQLEKLSIAGPRGSWFIETSLSSHIIKNDLTDGEEEYGSDPFGPEINQLITISSAPTFLMLISLNRANLHASVASGSKESIVLTHSRMMLPQLINIINRKKRIITDEFWKTSWNSPQEHMPTTEKNSFTSTPTEESFYIMMPDVLGKSLRGGLQILQDLHLHVTITGSGRITSQLPAAGIAVQEGETCTLELRSDN